MQNLDLPEPSDIEQQHSRGLVDEICRHIDAAGGWISFEQYMQLALYAPGLGYYSAGQQKFGERGDFITSPELGGLFAETLARPVGQVLMQMQQTGLASTVLEFGAGSGQLAADLLNALNRAAQLPDSYYILELSAELKQRQRETIRQQCGALLERVQWLDAPPAKPLNALVIANEVLDAMPVRRFCVEPSQSVISSGSNGSPEHLRVTELGVGRAQEGQGELILQSREASSTLLEALQESMILQQLAATPVAYCSEYNAHVLPWLRSLAEWLQQGVVYLIDYGYPRAEYYAAERYMGTFMGYYRHRALDAPLWYPGLQDLTAFVDFTLVAESALQAGFEVDGFTSQGNFLLESGIAELLEIDGASDIDTIKRNQQMKTLCLPAEMGERFKVMGLSRNWSFELPGFAGRDYRYRL